MTTFEAKEETKGDINGTRNSFQWPITRCIIRAVNRNGRSRKEAVGLRGKKGDIIFYSKDKIKQRAKTNESKQNNQGRRRNQEGGKGDGK